MRRWIVILSVLAIAGIALALVGEDTLDVLGIVLVGLAAVGAVSLGFYAIGQSEDRAREAEAREREPGRGEPERPGDGRLTARRPPRSRGDS